MPLYDYVCRECEHEFEALVRDGQKPACPSCGTKKLERKLSLPVAHTAGATPAPCPAKEAGSCGVSDCPGNRCGMDQWM